MSGALTMMNENLLGIAIHDKARPFILEEAGLKVELTLVRQV